MTVLPNNVIFIIRQMVRDMVCPDEFGKFKLNRIIEIIKAAGLRLIQIPHNGKMYYKVNGISAKTLFVSGTEEDSRIAVASDIHAGYKNLDWDKHNRFLDEGVAKGVRNFIYSGDITEGKCMHPKAKSGFATTDAYEQAKVFFDNTIDKLKGYKEKRKNVRLFFIMGNHDLMFPAMGEANPVKILVDMFNSAGIEAYFVNSFVCNLIIGGVCYRVVHLDDHYGSCLKYYNKVREYITVDFNGKVYPVAGLIAGHVHKRRFYDPIYFDYTKPEEPRKRTKKEINEIINDGYQPLFVAQPGSIKIQAGDEESAEFGYHIRVLTNEHGTPCSYKIL